MQIDTEYLRRHYASLSDDTLEEIDRSELVDTARECYDQELRRRGLSIKAAPTDPGVEPTWLPDAAEVLSRADITGQPPNDVMVDARNALEASGIPCYLNLFEDPQSEEIKRTHSWRLLVPGPLNQRATSILDRDLFNEDFEAEWRTHLELLSDEELAEMKPEVACCGLFDRIE